MKVRIDLVKNDSENHTFECKTWNENDSIMKSFTFGTLSNILLYGKYWGKETIFHSIANK